MGKSRVGEGNQIVLGWISSWFLCVEVTKCVLIGFVMYLDRFVFVVVSNSFQW